MPTPDHPLRLIHLVPADGCGGVETAARSAAGALSPACDLKLLLLAGPSLEPASPAVIAAPSYSSLSPRATATAVRRILSLDPDVLICSLWRSIPAALIARRLRPNIRLVAFLHAERRVHLLDDWLHRVIGRIADAIWADCAASLALLPERPGQQRRIISFLTERLAPVAAGAAQPHFVSWGRLHSDKAFDRAVELIGALKSCGIDARLDHWGPDQGEGSRLAALAGKLGVARSIRFHGPFGRPQLPAIAADGTFFLQTSRSEGFGMAVAEAMQLGLVPVVTPVGDIARYARDGENAVLLDPTNLDACAARIQRLLDDPSALAGMRERAIATFSHSPRYAEQLCAAALELEAAGR